ncbi:MAG: hypothetical protein Tsb0021_16910 [Chlamydiales bacterium]
MDLYMNLKNILGFCLSFSLISSSLCGAISFRNGKIVDADTIAEFDVEEHYELGMNAYRSKNWEEAIKQFRIVTENYPNTSQAREGYFRLGAAYYYESEFEEANTAFSNYITCQSHPPFFEEAMVYKLAIANAFTLGARRHVLGYRQLPKWFLGNELAEQIYDEISSTMPSHNLAAQALFSKGSFHWRNKEYRESVDAYQLLIKRFPKHPLSAHAYSQISKIYAEQSVKEFQNPDFIALSELNYKKFQNDFPGDHRLAETAMEVLSIKENYAKGLYDTGIFFEKTNKMNAAVLYYRNAIQQFPETKIADKCRKRLSALGCQINSEVST